MLTSKYKQEEAEPGKVQVQLLNVTEGNEISMNE